MLGLSFQLHRRILLLTLQFAEHFISSYILSLSSDQR